MERFNVGAFNRSQKMEDVTGRLDETRLSELQELEEFQTLQNRAMQQEASRMAKKHGANHPRVQRMQMQLAYQAVAAPALRLQIVASKYASEPLPENAWRLAGRVYCKQNQPKQNITVYLADEKGNWLQETGNACSDELGFYSITVDPKFVEKLQKRPPVLMASTASQKVVYFQKEPLTVLPNQVVAADIYLEGEVCADPPSSPGGGIPVRGNPQRGEDPAMPVDGSKKENSPTDALKVGDVPQNVGTKPKDETKLDTTGKVESGKPDVKPDSNNAQDSSSSIKPQPVKDKPDVRPGVLVNRDHLIKPIGKQARAKDSSAKPTAKGKKKK